MQTHWRGGGGRVPTALSCHADTQTPSQPVSPHPTAGARALPPLTAQLWVLIHLTAHVTARLQPLHVNTLTQPELTRLRLSQPRPEETESPFPLRKAESNPLKPARVAAAPALTVIDTGV